MSDIIFAKPRHDYASYADLYRLIELSAFPTCYIDEIDAQSDNTYIITVLNGEVPSAGYPDARARIILCDLEYHLDGVPALPGVEWWAADKWYAGVIGARYVPMGSHKGLLLDNTPKQDIYDVAFIGYLDGVPRRQQLRQQLVATGLNVSPPLAWGEQRHVILRSSAAYLHVHQLANAPAIPPLRMVVAAAYALPVITETCADPGIFKRHILQADYGYLSGAVATWTRSLWEKELLPRGMSLHQKLCVEMPFRKSIEAAL